MYFLVGWMFVSATSVKKLKGANVLNNLAQKASKIPCKKTKPYFTTTLCKHHKTVPLFGLGLICLLDEAAIAADDLQANDPHNLSIT